MTTAKRLILILFLAVSPCECRVFSQVASGELNHQLLKSSVTDGPAEIQSLLERGADVNAKNDRGETILTIAAEAGHADVVQLLLSQGANVDTKDEVDETPLDHAAQYNDPDVVKLLLDKGAQVNRGDAKGDLAPLFLAIMGYKGEEISVKREKVTLLLESGADPRTVGRRGQTPLMTAAQEDGFGDVITLMIKKSAQVNARDDNGETALFWAENGLQTVAMTVLLDGGADIGASDNNGTTPLMYAAKAGYIDGVKLLLSRGADVNAKDSKGRTALAYATEDRYLSPTVKARVVQLLRAHGAH